MRALAGSPQAACRADPVLDSSLGMKGHDMTNHQDDHSRRSVIAGGLGVASAALLASGRERFALARPAEPILQPEALKVAPGEDIRCGIIGVGGRGTGVLEAINHVAGVRVTAICDIDEAKAKAAAAKVAADQPRLFKDYKELISFSPIDVIFVETPCYLHADMVVEVMKSGRHCYGEKPMALSVADVERVVRAVEASRRVYQVGTQLPYAAPWFGAIKAVNEGAIGKPILIRAHRMNGGDLPHHIPWFFDRKQCGDIILEQAVHEFDIFNALLQDIPEQACGFGGQAMMFKPAGRNIRDHYAVVFDYGKDRKVAYSHAYISVPNVPCDGRSEFVYGTGGVVDVEYGMIYPRDGKPRKVEEEPKGDSTQLAVNHFFECVRNGRRPLTDVTRGRNGALVGLLGLKALDTGRTATMKELLSQGYSA